MDNPFRRDEFIPKTESKGCMLLAAGGVLLAVVGGLAFLAGFINHSS